MPLKINLLINQIPYEGMKTFLLRNANTESKYERSIDMIPEPLGIK